MAHLFSFVRVTFLTLCVSAPLAFLGWGAFGRPGLIILLAFSLILVFILGIKSEDWITALLGCPDTAPVGLKKTADRILSEPSPRIRVFPEAGSEAIVVRSWLSEGSILLSQGLVARLKEEELRALLWHCERILRSPGVTTASMFSFLAAIVIRISPRACARSLLEGRPASMPLNRGVNVGALLVFSILYTLVRIFLSWGGGSKLKFVDSDSDCGVRDAAMQKIRNSVTFIPLYGLLRTSEIGVIDRG